MDWALVLVVVAATTASDLIQSREMKQHGAIEDLRPGRWGTILASIAQRRRLIVAVLFMALSFFAFLKLLSVADLSFAVPATALSYVVETILARYFLGERVVIQRWAGVGLVACGVALLSL